MPDLLSGFTNPERVVMFDFHLMRGKSPMDTNQKAQGLILPFEVNHPLNLAFDPNTGGLVVEYWNHQGGQIGSVRVRLLLGAQSTEQLLSSLPTLQKEFGALIEARANKGFLQ